MRRFKFDMRMIRSIQLLEALVLPFVLALFVAGCNSDTGSDQRHEDTPKRYPIGLITTNHGTMHFWLYDETPNHKAKFIELATDHYYDDFVFNRVVEDFVIQGGCPDSPQYFDDSPYLLDPEFVDSIGHVYGALGMGRDNNPEKRSNACQLYVVSKETGLPNLDGNYMIIGKLIKGEETLEKIEHVPVDNSNNPTATVTMKVEVLNLTAAEIEQNYGFKP